MAITKILNIMESEGRNPASHLKNALEYIQNPDKTEECVLVGGINCLPDTAFEQMEETKNIFHKTGKRQGYHVIISFSPEEKVTAEQAMYVLEHFKYLMKRFGYVFKKDAWMEVQAPGFRYYHKLAKLDEMFSEDMLRHYVDMPWMAKPYFYSSDIRGLHRAKLSPFQKQFYTKLYRLRIVEQKRFVVGGAKYTEKARAGNGILRTRSSIMSIRYGMWECRKNWTN